jgi:hypothetical protein
VRFFDVCHFAQISTGSKLVSKTPINRINALIVIMKSLNKLPSKPTKIGAVPIDTYGKIDENVLK